MLNLNSWHRKHIIYKFWNNFYLDLYKTSFCDKGQMVNDKYNVLNEITVFKHFNSHTCISCVLVTPILPPLISSLFFLQISCMPFFFLFKYSDILDLGLPLGVWIASQGLLTWRKLTLPTQACISCQYLIVQRESTPADCPLISVHKHFPQLKHKIRHVKPTN